MNNMKRQLDILSEVKQEFKSAKTSINAKKLPSTFSKLEKLGVVKEGMIIADIGGGKFNNGVEWAEAKGAKLHVIDPYNRDLEHNKAALKATFGKAYIAMVNNVLNVIKESSARKAVLTRAKRALKAGGTLYVLIYEGNGSGEGGSTQKDQSYQNNMKTREYLDEVKSVFPNATIKNGMIVGTK